MKIKNHRRRAAFTLIELLVVIAILGILAAMLLPALAKAKARAQAIGSLSNIKQWALAQTLYVDDNTQLLPMTKIPSPGPSGLSPMNYTEDEPTWSGITAFEAQNNGAIPGGTGNYGRDAWFNALPPYIHSDPLYTYANKGSDAVKAYNRGANIFHCPTASSHPYDPLLNEKNDYTERVLFAYGINSKRVDPDSPATRPLKLTSIRNPSAVVAFSENRVRVDDTPYFGDAAKVKILGSPQCYTTRFSARHNKGGNISFDDGHAAWFKYDYVVLPQNSSGKVAADPGHPDIQWAYDGHTVP